MQSLKENKVYADNNATTPVDPDVKQAILPYLSNRYGNPSSLYEKGRKAEDAIEEAREKVALLLNVEPEEVVFTSCATEANNTVLKQIPEKMKEEGKGNHIITTKIEHKSIMESAKYMDKRGYDVTFLDVDDKGFVDLEQLKEELRPETVLVSVIYANNEVGTVQSMEEIGDILKDHQALFHTDAVQALGKLRLNLDPVDFASFSAHKVYGPKGVGALYLSNSSQFARLMHGGSQENDRRAGTENVPGIVGFGQACDIARANLSEEQTKLRKLQKKLIEGIRDEIDNIELNGPSNLEKRLPGNVNFSFKSVEGESIILRLDQRGIEASTGSACSSESLEPSHVLTAMGIAEEVAHGSLRIGLGRFNTEEDVDKILEELPEVVENLREMSAVDL